MFVIKVHFQAFECKKRTSRSMLEVQRDDYSSNDVKMEVTTTTARDNCRACGDFLMQGRCGHVKVW